MDWDGFDFATPDVGTPSDWGAFNFTDVSFDVEPSSFDWSAVDSEIWAQPTYDPNIGGWTDWNGGTSQPFTPVDATDVGFYGYGADTDLYPISSTEPMSDWGQGTVATPGFNVSGALNTASGALAGFTRYFTGPTQSAAPQRQSGTAANAGNSFANTIDAVASLAGNIFAARANVQDTANRIDVAKRNINAEVQRKKAMQDSAIPRSTLPGQVSPMMILGIAGVGIIALFALRKG